LVEGETSMELPKIQRGPLERNLNTYILLAGFFFTIAGGLTAGGYIASEFRRDVADLEASITRTDNRIVSLDRRTSALEVSMRAVDAHELRISQVESQMRDAASSMREVQGALNALASDMRLTREILERLERSQQQRTRSGTD
jgi:exonuclease VII small subunit